ncbi:MAG TPA: hypothetical protein VEK57_15810 [Thermoanaerobaculia bacterium]|nr:hypothetical protein [Thermoanaerobaculia bacterium]
MKFARRVFFVAGVYGVLVLVPQYFMESRIGVDFPPPITHPEHFYGFVGVALAWQVLFFLISRDPVRLRPAMLPAILEKLAFGVAAIVLYLQGRLAAPVLGAGLIDLVLAGLFFFAWRATGVPSVPSVP